MNPIVAVKNTERYTRAHISFQSTSSCNISTVNALNSCTLYLRAKEKGQEQKRKWVIEMNDARHLYLQTYGVVDNVDKMIKFSRMKLCSWKYWHAAMLHAKAMGLVVAYDMYLECAEGKINPRWKVSKPMSFWKFRDTLGQQMLSYSPKFTFYAGDDRMRSFTAMNQSQRKKKSSAHTPKKNRTDSSRKRRSEQEPGESDNSSDEMSSDGSVPITLDNKVSHEQFRMMKNKKFSRLCGNMSCLQKHINHLKKIKCPKQCEICGIDAYTVCTLCPGNPGVHFFPTKGIAKGKHCFLEFHSDEYFGITKSDVKLFSGMKIKDWRSPNKRTIKSNEKHITDIKKKLND